MVRGRGDETEGGYLKSYHHVETYKIFMKTLSQDWPRRGAAKLQPAD